LISLISLISLIGCFFCLADNQFSQQICQTFAVTPSSLLLCPALAFLRGIVRPVVLLRARTAAAGQQTRRPQKLRQLLVVLPVLLLFVAVRRGLRVLRALRALLALSRQQIRDAAGEGLLVRLDLDATETLRIEPRHRRRRATVRAETRGVGKLLGGGGPGDEGVLAV